MSRGAQVGRPKPLSRAYREDFDWAYDHYAALVKRFPNRWVAVAGRRVVAVARGPVRALRLAKKKARQVQIPVIFIEQGIHVYAPSVSL